MSRLFKVLSFAVAIVALAIFAMSCGSSSSSIRFVDAIPDSGAVNFDIALNGKNIFTNVGFPSVEPTSGYQKVSSGSNNLQVFNTGTTTAIITTTLNLSGSTQYTGFAMGFYHAPVGVLITDNNTAPTSGNVEFRIVNAAPDAPNVGVDVYIVPPGTDITTVSPNVSSLGYQQGSSYVSLAAAQYALIVTPAGNKTPIINQDYTLTTGQIRTFVVVDNSGGGSVATIPLELTDLG